MTIVKTRVNVEPRYVKSINAHVKLGCDTCAMLFNLVLLYRIAGKFGRELIWWFGGLYYNHQN